MRRIFFYPRAIGAFLSALLMFTSCHDDNSTVLSSTLIENQTLVPSSYSFIWNDRIVEKRTDVSANFVLVQGQTDKMKMTIAGIIPSVNEDLTLDVDVVGKSDEVQYQGKVDDTRYNLDVRGIYFPSTTGHFFKMKCNYSVKSGVNIEEAYDFFTPHKLNEKSGLKVMFKNDGTLDLNITVVNDKDVSSASQINTSYWLSKKEGQLIIELSEVQAATFVARWKEITGDDIANILMKYGDTDRYALYVSVQNGVISIVG